MQGHIIKSDRELSRDELLVHLDRNQRLQASATFRKERCEALMRRRSASKWDQKKKARMVRRLMTANDEVESSTAAIQYITDRLSDTVG